MCISEENTNGMNGALVTARDYVRENNSNLSKEGRTEELKDVFHHFLTIGAINEDQFNVMLKTIAT